MQKIAILGGGLAGVSVAMQLIKQADTALSLQIFDQTGQFGRGVAYQPRQVAHLLNVAAGKMSLDPALPADFLHWLQQQAQFAADEPAVLAQAYLPRAVFGDYVAQRWQESLALAVQKGLQVSLRKVKVTALDLTDQTAPRSA